MLTRALMILCLAAGLLLPSAAYCTKHQIFIVEFQFVPSKVHANYGDTIVWTNGDEFLHTVTSTGGSAKNFNSGNLGSGGSFSIVVNPSDGRGPFPYFCAIHPTMVDTVFVETNHVINMVDFAFKPSRLIINPGDTVTWVNQDAAQHTTTSDPSSAKSWDSDMMVQGDDYQVVFTSGDGPGPFPYRCTPHSLAMRDTLRINPLFCCQGTTGNVNASGIVDLLDLSLLVGYLTVPGPNPPKPTLPCPGEANVNAAGIIDLLDLSLLVGYLTVPGPVPPKPTLPPCS